MTAAGSTWVMFDYGGVICTPQPDADVALLAGRGGRAGAGLPGRLLGLPAQLRPRRTGRHDLLAQGGRRPRPVVLGGPDSGADPPGHRVLAAPAGRDGRADRGPRRRRAPARPAVQRARRFRRGDGGPAGGPVPSPIAPSAASSARSSPNRSVTGPSWPRSAPARPMSSSSTTGRRTSPGRSRWASTACNSPRRRRRAPRWPRTA